jgi:hypothetical protein
LIHVNGITDNQLNLSLWTSHANEDTLPVHFEALSKGLWTDLAEVTVSTCLIVEHFDVIEYVSSCQVSGFVDPFLDTLLFQAAEEIFSNSIDAPMSTIRGYSL